jgi:amino acid adenylation domain-containing protein
MTHNPSSVLQQNTLLSRFFLVTKEYPQRIAIQDSKRCVTYKELKGWVDSIASALTAQQIGEGDVVAVALTPSAELLATLVAIQAVGAAYIPIDIKAPKKRNLLILNDVSPALVIGSGINPGEDRFLYKDIRQFIAIENSPPVVNRSHENGIAYVIYTSGTTGKPKGVPITHSNLQALFTATEPFFQFRETDVGLLFHSFAFDFSVWEIWSVLGYGGKLIIPSDETRTTPKQLAKLIKEEGVTLLNQTPTAFSVNAEILCTYSPQELALRFVIFGGERLNFQTLRNWHQHFGLKSPRLVNMYGITETTVHASLHIISEDDLNNTESNIGKLLPHFDYIIRPCEDEPDNFSGELLLSGPQVTHGYLNINNEESGKFIWAENNGKQYRYYCSGDLVRRNNQGELIYMGRRDQQCKINGYRIETGEIESVLADSVKINEICVVATHSPC